MEFRKFDLRSGEEPLIIPIPHSYKDCVELIRSDFYRITGRRAPLPRLWVATWRNHSFRYNFWLRLSAHKGVLYVFCKWMLRRCSLKHGLWIPSQTAVGYGLYIGHGCGTIVNPTAVIGNNVYIGPGVSVVEHVTIGSGSCVGAGAVVAKDVPQGMTAVGVPAKVIGENRHEEYIGNRWECPKE